MKTWTNLLSQYQVLTKNTTPENITLGGININDSVRTVASIRNGKWKWLEIVEEVRTVGGKGSYQIPNNIRKVSDVYTRVGNNGQPVNDNNMLYMPIMVYDPYRWKAVLSSKLGSSDIPRFMYIKDDTLEVNPIPQSDNNIMYIRGRRDLRDMSIADYVTGSIESVPYKITLTGALSDGATSGTLNANWTLPTGSYEATFSNGEIRVVTLTNGATTITWTNEITSSATTTVGIASDTGGSIVIGNGTTWTTPMSGRYLQIADSSTTNKGDGFWYQIDKVLSTTALTLKKRYQGDAITSGTANYIIGQCSPIPEAYDIAPLYRAVAIYWDIQGDTKISERYWRLYDGGYEAGLTQKVGGIIAQMLEESGATEEGSYISPNGWEPWRFNPNNPEPDVAQSSF